MRLLIILFIIKIFKLEMKECRTVIYPEGDRIRVCIEQKLLGRWIQINPGAQTLFHKVGKVRESMMAAYFADMLLTMNMKIDTEDWFKDTNGSNLVVRHLEN